VRRGIRGGHDKYTDQTVGLNVSRKNTCQGRVVVGKHASGTNQLR